MIAILLLAMAVHPGGAPSDWKPVQGSADLEYRWSLPYNNACLVEFMSKNTSAAQQFQLTTRILSAPPAPLVQPNPDNPMHIAPTKVKPRTSDHDFSIRMSAMGRTSEMLHDCYGIQNVEGRTGSKGAAITSEPLSGGQPK